MQIFFSPFLRTSFISRKIPCHFNKAILNYKNQMQWMSLFQIFYVIGPYGCKAKGLPNNLELNENFSQAILFKLYTHEYIWRMLQKQQQIIVVNVMLLCTIYALCTIGATLQRCNSQLHHRSDSSERKKRCDNLCNLPGQYFFFRRKYLWYSGQTVANFTNYHFM